MMMMDEAMLSALGRWANFYVVVGSSAGALTGLQFVVITLVAQMEAASSIREIRAFGTPNVVHFSVALLISVLMNMPWVAASQLSISLGALAAIGFGYSLTVIRHARKQGGYSPDAADWFWYAIVPIAMFVLLGTAALLIGSNAGLSFFLVAAVSLGFLFNGIRNAWDTVTYVAIERGRRSGERKG
jgi:hypothetical protein